MHQMHPRSTTMGRVLHHYVAGGSHYWPIRSGALSAQLSDFIAYAHEWPVSFLFGDRRTQPSRTTEFRVGPTPELRRVITQLRRFFLLRAYLACKPLG